MDDVVADGTPDDEVTVGGDPPAVDIDIVIVIELPPELRAIRQSVNRV